MKFCPAYTGGKLRAGKIQSSTAKETTQHLLTAVSFVPLAEHSEAELVQREQTQLGSSKCYIYTTPQSFLNVPLSFNIALFDQSIPVPMYVLQVLQKACICIFS